LATEWGDIIDAQAINPQFVNTTIFFKMLLVPGIQGAVAAVLGVFLFSPGKPENFTKTFSFAIACGLAFPVYIQKASEMAHSTSNQLINAAAIEDMQTAYSQIQTGNIDSEDTLKRLNRSAALLSKLNYPKDIVKLPLVVADSLSSGRLNAGELAQVSSEAQALSLNYGWNNVHNQSNLSTTDFANFNKALNEKINKEELTTERNEGKK